MGVRIELAPGPSFTRLDARVSVNGVEVHILAERVQYLDRDGVLKTASFREFSRENLRGQYASLDLSLIHISEPTRPY